MSGHVRVGLEDSIFIGKGKLARSHSGQVLKIRDIVEQLGHSVATPAEAADAARLNAALRELSNDLDDTSRQ